MKIKRLTLYNIGPYVDSNTFDFSISKEKNIVLIGGKNGAGKTTFFKAIKTCLYGCKVWGFDAPGKEYISIINGLVNTKTLYDNSAKAYVELELLFDDGKQAKTYILHREWKKIKNSVTEYFRVEKNGDLIIGQEEDDFINYLLSIIPPDMFNFYFFDGESIADFFLGSNGNKNFRNAFLKLYGLDTLSIMVENFGRNITKSNMKNNSYAIFSEAHNSLDAAEAEYLKLTNDISELENKIDLCQIKIHSLQSEYTQEGGIGISEWKKLTSLLVAEENVRDNINRWLKEIANQYLPFIIIDKNLTQLLHEITLSQDKQKCELISDTFSGVEFKHTLENFLIDHSEQKIHSCDLIEFIKKAFPSTQLRVDFDFSTNQLHRIISQIYEKREFDKLQIKKAISELNSSLKKSKQYREKLNSSSIDGYEAFVDARERLEKKADELSACLQLKKQEMENQKIIYEENQNAFNKAKESYEAVLKNKSINDISERAATAFSLLEERLVLRQAKLLQQEFINCFTSIINKNNFIDGIVVDKNINIVPYKFITIKRNQLENYKIANKDFLSSFDKTKYIIEMNRLEFDEVDHILLPSPIKAPFSQGERQVYIMSIYLALLKTSHKDIPFFIDTPFARIDSSHRAKIVSEFFTKISNQIFVLSTDEEIVGDYKAMMDERISDKFVLQINSYGTTKIVSDQYFGDKL